MDPNDVVKETPFEKLGETETTPPSSQVQVVAPLDLPEGSTFVASVGEDGRTFTAVVVSKIRSGALCIICLLACLILSFWNKLINATD